VPMDTGGDTTAEEPVAPQEQIEGGEDAGSAGPAPAETVAAEGADTTVDIQPAPVAVPQLAQQPQPQQAVQSEQVTTQQQQPPQQPPPHAQPPSSQPQSRPRSESQVQQGSNQPHVLHQVGGSGDD
jgi:outer membrane biosynthesis protein TonB